MINMKDSLLIIFSQIRHSLPEEPMMNRLTYNFFDPFIKSDSNWVNMKVNVPIKHIPPAEMQKPQDPADLTRQEKEYNDNDWEMFMAAMKKEIS